MTPVAELVRRQVEAPEGPRVNLGCGRVIAEGWINADIVPLPGVDVVFDADLGWPWADGSVAELLASHVFEHVADPVNFMSEAYRVLMPGGILDIRVPGGRYAVEGYWLPHAHSFTDPTHVRHCTPGTWDYWIRGTDLHEGFGAGYNSPPVVFDLAIAHQNGDQDEELQVILRKPEWWAGQGDA